MLDGVGNRYMIMHERGELTIYPGRVTPVADFLTDLFKRVEAETVIGAAAGSLSQGRSRASPGRCRRLLAGRVARHGLRAAWLL